MLPYVVNIFKNTKNNNLNVWNIANGITTSCKITDASFTLDASYIDISNSLGYDKTIINKYSTNFFHFL